MSAIQEADRQYAHESGRDRPQQAWILSDRDVWYANPFYTGPAVPHPDDEGDDDGFGHVNEFAQAERIRDGMAGDLYREMTAGEDEYDDDFDHEYAEEI
jgi:hypothetical protein